MITRRHFAGQLGLTAAGLALGARAAEGQRWQNGRSPWPLCLDTASIRPQSLELYNPEYHQRDPDAFLPEAHAKTLAVIEKSG